MVEYCFYLVCVNLVNVLFVVCELVDIGVFVCVVVGFLFGVGLIVVKVFEVIVVIVVGVGEIDMVINIGVLKSGCVDDVKVDIDVVYCVCGMVLFKVIFEMGLLIDDEKVCVCEMCCDFGVVFVKMLIGFGYGGVMFVDVVLMCCMVGLMFGVKVLGGVCDCVVVFVMFEVGVMWFGMSLGMVIVSD